MKISFEKTSIAVFPYLFFKIHKFGNVALTAYVGNNKKKIKQKKINNKY